MIILDTNVLSEAMKPEPHPAVRAWLDEQVAETLYISSVTVAEILFGIGVLPAGRRKQRLTSVIDEILPLFEGRILAFDTDAARTVGKGFPTPDGYIAAIATARGFAVATRDASAFNAAGVPVIDPWVDRL